MMNFYRDRSDSFLYAYSLIISKITKKVFVATLLLINEAHQINPTFFWKI